jgi:hypothetical protein
MTDKMREEFEVYAASKGWEPRHMKRREDGGYEDWGVHPIWLAWQASRENIVVNIGLEDWPTSMANEIQQAIEAAGLKVKP